MSVETLNALRRGELAGARELTLRAGLTELPREVLALADTLEVLDLSGNALSSLPSDFNRLHQLRVLFVSGNRFERLPPVLGDCAALSQVGCRGAGVRELPAESLPPRLRWLTLTDNALHSVPAALGERPALQKLMLAGNQLSALPNTMQGLHHLDLLRLSANRFEALPAWLSALPRLAWLAWAGNPMDAARCHTPPGAEIAWATLQMGERLGEGASGHIHAAHWAAAPTPAHSDVAVKLFKGAMTSDGLPEREMDAALAAGAHPHLLGAHGRLSGHPDGAAGLVLPRLPAHWRPLAAPPSLASCSRDVYEPTLRLAPEVVQRMAHAVAQAGAHLHACGYAHGDLYAHNILWDGTHGEATLSDLGAASLLPTDPAAARALQALDVRAWGLLLGELLACCDTLLPDLQQLHSDCVQAQALQRPTLADISRHWV